MVFRKKRVPMITAYNLGYRLGMLGEEGMNIEKVVLEILGKNPKQNQVKVFEQGLRKGKEDRTLIKENLEREQFKERIQELQNSRRKQIIKEKGIDLPDI